HRPLRGRLGDPVHRPRLGGAQARLRRRHPPARDRSPVRHRRGRLPARIAQAPRGRDRPPRRPRARWGAARLNHGDPPQHKKEEKGETTDMRFFDAFHNPPAGLAILRWTLAILLLLHGIAKITGGISGIEGMLAKAGLPTFLAYGTYIGEVVAPLLLLINRFVVPAALIIVIQLLFASGLAHTGELFKLSRTGGWAIELQAFFLLNAVVVALTAPRTGGK